MPPGLMPDLIDGYEVVHITRPRAQLTLDDGNGNRLTVDLQLSQPQLDYVGRGVTYHMPWPDLHAAILAWREQLP